MRRLGEQFAFSACSVPSTEGKFITNATCLFVYMNKKKKIIDLFCGAGGFSTGFNRREFEVIAGVDVNDDALETFENNHDVSSHNLDLSNVEANTLLDRVNVDTEELDGIIGGPPCQGFSQAGNRDADDDRNKLVKNYFDIIDEIEPQFFVMENVRAITYERNKHTIEFIESRIAEMGYNHVRGVLTAADFGVPQTRKRLFIIGMKSHQPNLPSPTHAESEWVGISDVIDVPDGQIVSSYGTQETLRGERNTRTVAKPSYTLRATKCLVDIIPNDYTPPGEDEELPSITDVRIYRFDEEDAAQIQSFPPEYEFIGNRTSQRKQIGNAVPPKLAECIASEIERTVN